MQYKNIRLYITKVFNKIISWFLNINIDNSANYDMNYIYKKGLLPRLRASLNI